MISYFFNVKGCGTLPDGGNWKIRLCLLLLDGDLGFPGFSSFLTDIVLSDTVTKKFGDFIKCKKFHFLILMGVFIQPLSFLTLLF